ncbi:MAG: TetR/AcrR family transcriptional regulator [Mycobacterium sp.]
MQLHKRDVVAAATAILDNYGIADLTMRRLARELAITPGALYWHFVSKQELLGAVADQLLRPVRTGPTADPGWRDRVTGVCTGMRNELLAHTDGAELVSASFAVGQSRAMTEILGLLADAAHEAGLDAEHAGLAARTVAHYVLGFTADEQSRLQWSAMEPGASGASAAPALAGAGPAGNPDGRFAFGLRLLIDGLAVHGGVPVS